MRQFGVWAFTLVSLGALAAEAEDAAFVTHAADVPPQALDELLVQSDGRLMPFDSFARQSVAFVTGSRAPFGLPPAQTYLAYLSFKAQGQLPFILVSDADVRELLGLPGDRRRFSLDELSKAGVEARAREVRTRQAAHAALTPEDQGTLTVFRRYAVAREIAAGRL